MNQRKIIFIVYIELIAYMTTSIFCFGFVYYILSNPIIANIVFHENRQGKAVKNVASPKPIITQ